MPEYGSLLAKQWNKELKSVRITGFIVSVLMLVFGVCCIVWPAQSMTVISVIASVLIVVLGAFEIVSFCLLPPLIRRAGTLISGILNVIIGSLLLFSPTGVTLAAFTYMMGFMLMLFGIDLLAFAGRLHAFAITGYGWLIFNGIANIITSLIFLFLPMASALVLNYMTAIYLLIGGLSLLIETVSMNDLKA